MSHDLAYYSVGMHVIYHVQMAKQTMGTPLQSFPYRMDSKLYRLQVGVVNNLFVNLSID